MVLERVWQDEAFLASVLDAELSRHPQLDARDARLVTELVYGVLRTQRWLERQIDSHVSSERYKNQPAVRAAMLTAAYSLLVLDRIPAFAAVSQAVAAIKRGQGPRVAGFANAVLRKLARQAEQSEESREELLARAAYENGAGWLRRGLARALDGKDGARAFLGAGPVPPPTSLCLAAGADRDTWLATLAQARPNGRFEAGSLSPRAIVTQSCGQLRELPGFDQAWRIQEEGAQLIGLAVGAQPGERILDACAGRGGKTLLLAEQVGASGSIEAADLYAGKLEQLLARHRGAPIHTHAVDWTIGSGSVDGKFDRILVDAPCTGVGTLRRRPEIALRLTGKDVPRIAALQLAIVRGAARHLKPGGTLLYAVCSVLRPECEQIVEALGSAADGAPALTPCSFQAPEVRALAGDSSSLRLLPHQHGCDGYFLACLEAR